MMTKTLQKLFTVLGTGVVLLAMSSTAFAQIMPFNGIITLDKDGDGNIDAVVLLHDGSGSALDPASVPDYDGFVVAGYTFDAVTNGGAPQVVDFEAAFPAHAAALNAAGVANVAAAADGDLDLILHLNELTTPDGGALPEVTYDATTGDLRDTAGPPANDVTQISTFTLIEADGVFAAAIGQCTKDNDGDGKIDQVVITMNENVTGLAAADFADVTGAPAVAHAISGASGGGTATITLDINEVYAVPWTGEVLTMTYTPGSLTDSNGLAVSANLVPPGAGGFPAANFAVADCVAPFMMTAETLDTPGANAPYIATEGNGQLDGIIVTYSEVMATVTDGMAVATHTIAGNTGLANTTTGTPAALIIYTQTTYTINETGFDTDDEPAVSYATPAAPGVPVRDPAGNELQGDINSGSLNADDDAPPAIIDVCTLDLNKDGFIDAVDIRVSEPLSRNIATIGNAFGDFHQYVSDVPAGGADVNITVAATGLTTTGAATMSGAAGAVTLDATQTELRDSDETVRVVFAAASATTFYTDEAPTVTYLRDGVNNWQDTESPIANDVNPTSVGVPPRAVTTPRATDKARPVVLFAATADDDCDGKLDTYCIVYSENMDDASFGADGVVNPAFAVTGHGQATMEFSPTTIVDVANDNIIYINFPEGTAFDTDARPEITTGSLTNITVSTVVSEVNEVPPVVDDPNAGGNLDILFDGTNFIVTGGFSNLTGNFTAAHIHNAAAGANGPVLFTLTPDLSADSRSGVFTAANNTFALTANAGGLTAAQVQTEFENGNLYFNIHSATNPNGELRGQVAGVNGKDGAGNLMCPVATALAHPADYLDDANIVTVNAVSQVASTNLRVSFSEPPAAVAVAHFGYVDVNTTDAGAITAVASFIGGSESAVLTVNANFTVSDATTDRLAAGAGMVDGAGAIVFPAGLNVTASMLAQPNPMKTVTQPDMSIDDTVAPAITQVKTLDIDRDGKVDAIVVTFDEDVDDSSLSIGNWTVAGHTTVALIVPAGAGTAYTADAGGFAIVDFADDTRLVFSVDEIAGEEGDTDDTPQVDVTAGGVSDFKPNGVAAASNTAVDCAGPAIMTHTQSRIIGPATVELRFSEPITTATLGTGDLGLDMGTFDAVVAPFGLGAITDVHFLDGNHGARVFLAPNNLFNSNSTPDVDSYFTFAGAVTDAATGTIANDQIGAPGGAGIRLNNAQGISAPTTGCSMITDVAGTNGAVLNAKICRSNNDPFSGNFVDGSTTVTRYEVYQIAAGGTCGTDPMTLVASVATPSSASGVNEFTFNFPIVPANSAAFDYCVVAVGGGSAAKAGDDITPINVAEITAGDNLDLVHELQNGETASSAVFAGSVTPTDDFPPAPGILQKITDGPSGQELVMTFTPSPEAGQTVSMQFPGLLNLPGFVSIPLVTTYNISLADGTPVTSVAWDQVTTNGDGTVSITFTAPSTGSETYTLSTSDGINSADNGEQVSAAPVGGSIQGDLNFDGMVDVSDLAIFADRYGSMTTDDNYSPDMDFDSDGEVDLADYVTFAAAFGSGPASAAKTSDLPQIAGDLLRMEIEGNRVIVKGEGLNVKALQLTLATEGVGATFDTVEGGMSNALDAYFEADGKVTYATASLHGNLGDGTVAIFQFAQDVTKAMIEGGIAIAEDGSRMAVPAVEAREIPEKFALLPNYPNPFNPTTNIQFNLPETGEVTLQVFDITGRLVNTLVSGTVEAGIHTITWNARDASGAPVASGIYLYRIQAGDLMQVKKMTLLK